MEIKIGYLYRGFWWWNNQITFWSLFIISSTVCPWSHHHATQRFSATSCTYTILLCLLCNHTGSLLPSQSTRSPLLSLFQFPNKWHKKDLWRPFLEPVPPVVLYEIVKCSAVISFFVLRPCNGKIIQSQNTVSKVLIGSISLFLWELLWAAQNNTDVRRGTGGACGGSGTVVCVFSRCLWRQRWQGCHLSSRPPEASRLWVTNVFVVQQKPHKRRTTGYLSVKTSIKRPIQIVSVLQKSGRSKKNLGSNCWNGVSVFDWLFPGENPWVDEVEECKQWKSRHGCAVVLVIKPYHISAHKSGFERERWQRLDGMRAVHSLHKHMRHYWTEKVTSGFKKYSSISKFRTKTEVQILRFCEAKNDEGKELSKVTNGQMQQVGQLTWKLKKIKAKKIRYYQHQNQIFI